MPDLLSASSQSLLAGLLGNYSLDGRVRPWPCRAPRSGPSGRAVPGMGTGSAGLPGHRSPAPAPAPARSSSSAAAWGAACTKAAAPVAGVSQDQWAAETPPQPAARSLFPGAPGCGRAGAGQVTARVWGNQGRSNRMLQSTRLPCFLSFPCPANTGRSQPGAWTQVGLPPPSTAPVPVSPEGQKHHVPRPPAHSYLMWRPLCPHGLICTGFHHGRSLWLSLLSCGAEVQLD